MIGNLRFQVSIAGELQLDRKLHGYLGALSDFTPAFEAMAEDWKTTQAAVFAGEGAHEGLPAWAPLSPKYAAWKANKFPGALILERTGALRKATTEPGVEITPLKLQITVDAPYGIYHQSPLPRTQKAGGGDLLPRRPFASLTPKQKSRWIGSLRRAIQE